MTTKCEREKSYLVMVVSSKEERALKEFLLPMPQQVTYQLENCQPSNNKHNYTIHVLVEHTREAGGGTCVPPAVSGTVSPSSFIND